MTCRLAPTAFFLLLLTQFDPAEVSAEGLRVLPEILDLGVARPGASLTGSLVLHNDGQDEQQVLVTVSTAEFSVAADTLGIPAGSSLETPIGFSSSRIGEYEGQVVFELKQLFGSKKLTVPVVARVVRPRLKTEPAAGQVADMCTVPIGETRRLSVEMSNPGPVALMVDSVYLEDRSGPFALKAGQLAQLSAGDRHSIEVAFTPSRGGTFETHLVIASSDLEPPRVRLPLRAIGLAPKLAVSPLPEVGLDFELLEVGENRTLPVSVVNRGQAALHLESVDITGEAFSATAGDTAVVEAGQRLDIAVRYDPVGESTATGQLVLTSNDPDAEKVVVPLRGRSTVSPAIVEVLNSTLIDFGAVPLGKSTKDHLILWNRGGSSFTVGLGLEPTQTGEFDLESASVLLIPGQSSKVEIRFSPREVGARTADLWVETQAGRSRYQLLGTGKFLQLSPSTKDFDRIPVGESNTSIVDLMNTGNADFTVTRISSTADDFTVNTQVSFDNEFLLPAESQRSLPINITFAPSARGLRTAVLSIEGFWEEGAETFDILLNGTGVAAEIELIPSGPLNFDWVVLGETETRTLVATNTGDTALKVVSNPLTREARVEPASFALGPGESTRLQVYFAPEALGGRFGQILLVSNDVSDKAHAIKVKGRGALESVDLTGLARISVTRSGHRTPISVPWNNQSVILTDDTRVKS